MTLLADAVTPRAKARAGQIPDMLGAGIVGLLCLIFLAPVAALLVKSVQDSNGNFVYLDNFATYFANKYLTQAIINTIVVSSIASLLTTLLAFLLAYGITRTCMPLRKLVRLTVLFPLLAPSLLPAIALIYIFGNQGILRFLLDGASIYGPIGIVMAEIFHGLPFAFIIIQTALATTDARLYESAQVLSASPIKVFLTVTFPSARFAVFSALSVVFTIVAIDFGVAKVISGRYAVIAAEIYRQIIGQQNFQLGAVIGVLMLFPALLAFVVQAWARSRNEIVFGSKSIMYVPRKRPVVDMIFLLIAVFACLSILFIVGVSIFASLVKFWPYNMALGFQNYTFNDADASGWGSFYNSLETSVLTVVVGSPLIFMSAYLVERSTASPIIKTGLRVFAMLPLAIPGIALGLGYIFFFNNPDNPLSILYRTIEILALCSVAHFYTVPHIIAQTSLRKIDPDIEQASSALGAPSWKLFGRVIVPMSAPAIIDMAILLFVSTMTSVDSVIFLYSSNTKLAAVAIIDMDDRGYTAAACAMAVVIMATCLAAKLIQQVTFGTLFPQPWKGDAPKS